MDVNSNINLTWLDLSNNQLQEMDVKANVRLLGPALSNNQLQKIDVSANINLTYLSLFSKDCINRSNQ